MSRSAPPVSVPSDTGAPPPGPRPAVDGIVLPRALAHPIGAAAAAACPEAVVRTLLQRYRFDSLSYFVTRSVRGFVGGELHWSTLPAPWVARYRREGFVAVDPRLARARAQIGPTLWDACEFAADPHARRFLAAAAAAGVRSGVAIALTDGQMNRVTVTFDSARSPVDAARRDVVVAAQGDLLLIAIALHEFVLKWRTGGGGRSAAALTLRERDCLELAARGLTSAGIGTKLRVAERTVNFHFSNIKTKLGATNRPEAIARGIAMGIVSAASR